MARASARGAAGLGRRRTIPGRGGSADPACPRQSDLLLAARDRAGADRGAGGDADALLLQELQRHRHAAALAATILPDSLVGPGLRRLGRAEGLPELPLNRMGLIHAPGRPSEEAKALAEAIRETVGAPARQAAA